MVLAFVYAGLATIGWITDPERTIIDPSCQSGDDMHRARYVTFGYIQI